MKCLSKALSCLLQYDVEEQFFKYREPPWCDVDLMYVAWTNGVVLMPFAPSFEGVTYPGYKDIYAKYSGILCCDSHAEAKIGDQIPAIENLSTVFFAWMNEDQWKKKSLF